MELKNTLKIIGISMLGVLGVGMSCYSHSVGMTLLAPSYENASAYSVNEYQDSVTFTKEELNNCSYPYLTYSLSQNYTFVGSYVTYNNLSYEFGGINENYLSYIQSISGDEINFGFQLSKFGGDVVPFEYSLTIYSNFFVENMAKQTYLTASQLNNNTYEYLATQLTDLQSDSVLQDSYIIYQNTIYKFYSWNSNGYFEYADTTEELFISFNNVDVNKWTYTDVGESETYLFTDSITIYSTYIADNLYAPNQPVNLLTAIVGLLTGGITGIASGIGSGVSTLTQQIFIVDNALSVFGGILVVFAAISLAIGLCRWIMQFLTSLGAKK